LAWVCRNAWVAAAGATAVPAIARVSATAAIGAVTC
jgi:hypothetical protein